MKKGFPLLVAALTMLLALSITIIPEDTAHAEIKDGTYEINYEMKEAGNENTSIADGFFNKPATLTVENGDQYIRLTVTSSSMIRSLSSPTGEVDVVEEDEEEETRTVKFRVDEDLSEPVSMEMHVVVPDLYDTTHTARAFFDTDSLDLVSDDKAVDTSTEADDDKAEDENAAETGNNAEATDEDDENDGNAGVEGDKEVSTEDIAAETQSQDDSSSTSALWIALAIIGVLIIAGVLFLVFRKKRVK